MNQVAGLLSSGTKPTAALTRSSDLAWSVMMPCYNPRIDYLEQALHSVLDQDPGAGLMQIEIIDDCSTQGDLAEAVRKIAGDRVSVYREPRNLGLAGVWNRCIERARGEWIHIFHQDDVLLPGFYEALGAGTRSSLAPGLVYCRHAFIDGDGHWSWLSDLDAKVPGLLPNALSYLARAQVIQTPAVIVKRSVYDALGGFRSDLCYTLDWEMWCRIAARYPVWYEPRILSCYRVHSSAATSRLVKEGKDIKDYRRCIEVICGYLPSIEVRGIRRFALFRCALRALQNAGGLFSREEFIPAFRQIVGSLRCSRNIRVWFWASRVILRAFPLLLKALIGRGARSVPSVQGPKKPTVAHRVEGSTRI